LPKLRPGSPAESAAIALLMAIAAHSAEIVNTLVLMEIHEDQIQSGYFIAVWVGAGVYQIGEE